MYDELVKKIRHCATDPMHCLSCGEDKDGRCFKRLMTQAADAIEDLEFACNRYEKDYKVLCEYLPKWIPVTERLPDEFVSVQAHMTDAGQFPSVREAYLAGGKWYFPALNEYHPVDKWAEFSEPPKEE